MEASEITMAFIATSVFMSKESEIKSQINSLKVKQAQLNEMLGKKMQEAQSLTLDEKSRSLTEMMTYQVEISQLNVSITKLEENLKSIQKEKEDEAKRLSASQTTTLKSAIGSLKKGMKVTFNPAASIISAQESNKESHALNSSDSAINSIKNGLKVGLKVSFNPNESTPKKENCQPLFSVKEKFEEEVPSISFDDINKTSKARGAESHGSQPVAETDPLELEIPSISFDSFETSFNPKVVSKPVMESDPLDTEIPSVSFKLFKNPAPKVYEPAQARTESEEENFQVVSQSAIQSDPTDITIQSASFKLFKNQAPRVDKQQLQTGTQGEEEIPSVSFQLFKNPKTPNPQCTPPTELVNHCQITDSKGAEHQTNYVEVNCPGLKKEGSHYYRDKMNPILSRKFGIPYHILKSVLGDGSCGPYSILEQMRFPDMQMGARNTAGLECHLSFRKAISNFMGTNEELRSLDTYSLLKDSALMQLAEQTDLPKECQTFEYYLKEMENPKRMVDGCFLQAAALYLGKDILVVSEDNESNTPWTLIEGTIEGTSFKSHGPPITIAHMEKHFMPLNRIKSEASGCRGCGKVTQDIKSHLVNSVDMHCQVFYRENVNMPRPIEVTEEHAAPDCGVDQLTQEIASQLAHGIEIANVQEVEVVVDNNTEITIDVNQNMPSMEVFINECPHCHEQYANRDSLRNHLKRLKGMCLTKKFCKDDHSHDLMAKKFSTKEEVMTFIDNLDGPKFVEVYNPKEQTDLECKCTVGCQAKITYKPVKRQDSQETIEFVLHGCTSHKQSTATDGCTSRKQSTATDGVMSFMGSVERLQQTFPADSEEFLEQVLDQAGAVTRIFETVQAANEYIKEMELDSVMRTNSKAERKNGDKYEMFYCRRREDYEPKVYNTKKNTKCKAMYKLNIHPNGTATMKSMLEHNHVLDEHAVISQKLKESLKEDFRKGVNAKTVFDKLIALNPSERTKGRLPDRKDLRQLELKYGALKVNITNEERDNVNMMLKVNPAWREFSLPCYGEPPQNIKHKEVKRDEVFLMYMSDVQRKIFAQYPETLQMDGSHGTNRHGLKWINFMVFDDQGAGIPVAHALVPEEKEEAISPALKIIKELEPEAAARVQVVATDLAKSFLNSFQKVVNDKVKWVPCAWHLERAWRKNLQKSVPKLYKDLQALRLDMSSEEDFKRRLHILDKHYSSPNASALEREKWKYVIENYGEEGTVAPASTWARVFQAGCVPHNLYIERLHGEFKLDNPKSNARIDECMYAIHEMAQKKDYAFEVRRQRRGIGTKESWATRLHNMDHHSMKGYSVHPLEEAATFIVIKEPTEDEDAKFYILRPNQFRQCKGVADCEVTTKTSCKVVCKTCPSLHCSHDYTCQCEQYARTNHCKHQHHLAMHLMGVPHLKEEPIKKPRVCRRSGQMPTLSTKRKHVPQPQFGKLPVPKKQKKKKNVIEVDPRDTGISKSLILLISQSPKSEDWGSWVCGDKSQFEEFLKPLTEKEQSILKQKYGRAQVHWTCTGCPEITVDKHKKGWVTCAQCDDRYHITCSPFDTPNEARLSVNWFCQTCTTYDPLE